MKYLRYTSSSRRAPPVCPVHLLGVKLRGNPVRHPEGAAVNRGGEYDPGNEEAGGRSKISFPHQV